MAKHLINPEDFKDYVVEHLLASSSSASPNEKGKRLMLIVNTTTNKVSYNISQDGFTKCTAYNLKNAIEVYNSL